MLCGRLPGIGLNAEGVGQAQNTGRYLANRAPLQAVYSSPLERTRETARIIAGMQSPEPRMKIDERLNEMEFGDWTGLPFQSLQSMESWHRYNASRSLHAPPRGEALTHVQARAWECVSQIAENHPEATVAVVTHADVIRALLVLFLGMPLDLLPRIQVNPGSISEAVIGGGYPFVPQINFDCNSHLPK